MMKKLLWIIVIAICAVVFHKFLFSFSPIGSGDYTQLQPQTLQYFVHYPFSAWDTSLNVGINNVGLLNHAPFNLVVGVLGSIGISISLLERLVWWVPFLFLGGSTIFLLARSMEIKLFSPLAIMLYCLNTYILLVLAGGQIQGIGLAYALAPLLLFFLQKIGDCLIDTSKKLRLSLIYSLLLGAQMVLDPRITYISLVASFVYGLVYIIAQEDVRKNLLGIIKFGIYGFVVPIAIMLLLHAFWILPTVLVHENPLTQFGTAYTTTNAVAFFSFAKFENTLGLLHPNWPENIFGKTYFMKPEFLLLPIFAFSALFFIKKSQEEKMRKRNIQITFFVLLGIIGIFLAKGAQDPFGGVYLWMFDHIPGFVMFRDPTKWYLLIAISYSVLIPYAVGNIYFLLKDRLVIRQLQRKVVSVQNIFVILVIGCLVILIGPAILGRMSGTFQNQTIPWEYQKLSTDLQKDSHFSRVLWVPTLQRYAYSSVQHPKVSASELFQTTNPLDIAKVLRKETTREYLQDISMAYVIVPYDSEKEIFLKDRSYDEVQYKQLVSSLNKVLWLKRLSGYGRIAVFAVSNQKDHLWMDSPGSVIQYAFVRPTEYKVSIKNAKNRDKLIFTEAFDSHWSLETSNYSIPSKMSPEKLNTFVIPKDGDVSGRVIFTPQEWVARGLIISVITGLATGIFLLITSFKPPQK